MTLSLFISASLFPSKSFPQTGLFVCKRLESLRGILKQELMYRLVSPTPYFPFPSTIFGRYGLYAQKPKRDIIKEFAVAYPRYIQLPFIGNQYAGECVAWSLESFLRHYIKDYGKPDILIAEYCFPDGLALSYLGQKYHIPVVMTARGSDISYFPQNPVIHKKMVQAFGRCAGIIAVSHDIAQDVISLGASPDKITVIGNGVDTEVFCFKKQTIREKYQIKTKYILISVGGLIKRKGHDFAITMLSYLPDVSLVIAGEGEEYRALQILAENLNVSERVLLVGRKTQEELAEFYNAGDIFLLCSQSEGRANVLLEAASCGLPLASVPVQGTREIITSDDIGIIFKGRVAKDNAEILQKMLTHPYERQTIRNSVLTHNWENCGKTYANFLFSVRDKYLKSF